MKFAMQSGMPSIVKASDGASFVVCQCGHVLVAFTEGQRNLTDTYRQKNTFPERRSCANKICPSSAPTLCNLLHYWKNDVACLCYHGPERKYRDSIEPRLGPRLRNPLPHGHTP